MSNDTKSYSNIVILLVLLIVIIIIGSLNTGFYGLYKYGIYEHFDPKKVFLGGINKDLQRSINQINTHVRTLGQQVGKVDKRVSQVDERLGQVDERVGQVDTKLASVSNAKPTSTITKDNVVDTIKDTIKDTDVLTINSLLKQDGVKIPWTYVRRNFMPKKIVSRDYVNKYDDISAVNKDISGNTKSITDVNKKLTSHKNNNDRHWSEYRLSQFLSNNYSLWESSIKNIQRRLSRAMSKIKTLDRQRKPMSKNIKVNTQSIKLTNKILSNLNRDLNEEKQKLNTRFEDVYGNISRIDNTLDTQDKNIGINSENIESNKQGIMKNLSKNNQQDSSIAVNKKEIARLNNEFNALKQDIHTLASTMADKSFNIQENIIPVWMKG